MAGFNTKTTQQWRISSATITADRGVNIDVTDKIVEMKLYENIYFPFVSGQVAIGDNIGLLNKIGVMGTERLNVVVEGESYGEEVPSEDGLKGKVFVMKRLSNQVKANSEKTSAVAIFDLIEEHVVASNVQKISRTIKEDFLLEILKLTSDMGIAVDITQAKPAKQTKWKAYIPYLSPLDAIRWLIERATTNGEMPYVLYSSMHNRNIKLASLDTLMQQSPFNPTTPYVYSSATVQNQEYSADRSSPDLRDLSEKHWHITNMKADHMQDQLEMTQKGAATGSRITVTNINGANPLISTKHNSMIDTLGKMSPLFRGLPQNVYDEAYNVVGAGPMHDNEAAQYHKIVSENTFTQRFKDFHYEESIDEYMPVLTANAVKASMQKNTFTIEINGSELLKQKKGVGDLINLLVYADSVDLENAEEKIDKLKSGVFLITAVAHTFKVPDHKAVLEVTKFSKDPSLG